MESFDWSILTNLIGSLGFPIIVCVAMFKYIKEKERENREDMKELTQVIANNNQILSRLVDKIEELDNGHADIQK